MPPLLQKIASPIQSAINHRRLLHDFIHRDILGRFAGSYGGALWTLITPVVTILVFMFIFSTVLRIRVSAFETGTDSFFIYFLSGYFPWLIFSESLNRSVNILIENSNLITKVSFPVELLPAGTVISSFLINGIGMVLFYGYLTITGYLDLTWILVPLVIIPLHILFISGLSYILAALCVFIRDMRDILGLILMVWFYATPIIYPVSMVPESFSVLIQLNPLTWFVELYRGVSLMHQISWFPLIQVSVLSLLTYCLGAWFFMRARPAFGDVL